MVVLETPLDLAEDNSSSFDDVRPAPTPDEDPLAVEFRSPEDPSKELPSRQPRAPDERQVNMLRHYLYNIFDIWYF